MHVSGKNISDSGVGKRLRQCFAVRHSICNKFCFLCCIVGKKRMVHARNNRFAVFLTFLRLFQNPFQKLVTDHAVSCAPVCLFSVYILCIYL